MKQPRARWPWDPVELEVSEVAAIKAIASGTANEYQQRRAFQTIIEKIARIDAMSFTAGGQDGSRATDFAEGRRWVGRTIRNVLDIKYEVDPRGPPPAMPAEPAK